jgi:peptidoglycan hydrolase-like protein with peptidoglycan-binding domain
VRSRRPPASSGRGALAAAIARHPREFVGIVMAAAATLAILVNALFLQHGPHPAPIFATRAPVKLDAARVIPKSNLAPRLAPAPAAAPPRSQAQVVGDIQRELHRRGFYDGAVDGIWGAKTDAAARAFVQAAGLKIDPAPNAALLQALAAADAGASAAPEPARKDAIAALIAPSKRLRAIQQALADFGYGQIKPTGVYDGETRTAIEKFERSRNLPVDGQITDRFVRDLAGMTGRPLE